MIRAKRRKPFSFIRTVTVGFGVAPNLLTPPPQGNFQAGGRRSRAWAFALTAGGDFHPALRTSADPGWNGLVWNYKASIPAGKARDTPKWHVPMPEKSNLDTEKCGETGPAGSLTNCKGESDSDLFSSVNF
jgi:hypothetical protein